MSEKIISESDFDNACQSTTIGDNQIESHRTLRQNSNQNEAVAIGSPIADPGVADIISSSDRINNLSQKETAMARSGVTRAKTYGVIARLLDAKKWTDVVDAQGNVKRELVDDLDRQKLGADMALKAFGDMVERKEIEYDVGGGVIEVYRKMSVAELKQKAAELLLGKRAGPIEDAEVVR